MKKKEFIFIGIVILILITLIILSFNQKEDNKLNYQNITAKDAITEIENDPSIIILDVRTKEEYDEKHIPNSILIDVNELKEQALSILNDKHAKIFVYCQSGIRAKEAAQILIDLGYENVYNLGGLNEWPYETE